MNITKQDFLNICSQVWDQLDQPTLFDKEDGNKEGAVKDALTTCVKKLISPYKSYKPMSRLDNIAEHYKLTTYDVRKLCDECGIKLNQSRKGHQAIVKEDVEFLVTFIQRKYNNFNEYINE